jgi:hypothetical protein
MTRTNDEIRLSGYDECVFQDSDAGEVRQDPDPAMELAFNFNEEDAGFPPYPSSNPTVHCNPNPNVRTGDGCESDPGSEAAEEADQEELTQASDVSSESSEEEDPETGDFEPPDGISFESAYVDESLVGREIAHTFTTGWEIGMVKGIEKDSGRHKSKAGQYIVKYKTERYPIWHELNKAQYGPDSVWVLIKK